LFNGNVEQTLIGRVSPTEEQRTFLQQQWNDLADHLKHELPAKHGYPMSSWLQGSYKFGTQIKPVRLGEEYDVDFGIYFEWEHEDVEPTPGQLREWVQNELIDYNDLCAELKKIEEPPLERCSRATYIKQFHVDTLTYHLAPTKDRRRLACLSNRWEHSDPKAIYKWFRDAVSGSDRDQLRRLVRYLKDWAALSFDDAPDSRPSSIMLTVLITQAYQGMFLDRLVGVADDDALIAVIKTVHERLFGHRAVPNPIDTREDLNRMNGADWEGFLPRLEALRNVAQRAAEAEDEATAALIWAEAFSFLMPLPEVAEVEMVEQSSGRAVMQLPEIDIMVYARDKSGPGGRRFIETLRNEVPSVTRNCELVFKIVNPHVVPEYAMVEWTVRNEGDEADKVSDLGHRTVGMRLLENDERTAYSGRHFMDCVIRLNRTVYAVRRVPVTIRDIDRPARNPPRPAYTKLRKFLKRR
jgi:hypothetical protein